MNRRHLLCATIALPVLGWPKSAWAHRELITTTEMDWNIYTQAIEITHIFHIHHTERALRDIGVVPTDNLQDQANQARLVVYVEDNFSLEIPDSETLDINTIGAESDGSNVYVYQECKMSAPPKSLLVACTFLRPDVKSQINEVHLNIHNQISSIRLSGRQTQKLLIAK